MKTLVLSASADRTKFFKQYTNVMWRSSTSYEYKRDVYFYRTSTMQRSEHCGANRHLYVVCAVWFDVFLKSKYSTWMWLKENTCFHTPTNERCTPVGLWWVMSRGEVDRHCRCVVIGFSQGRMSEDDNPTLQTKHDDKLSLQGTRAYVLHRRQPTQKA